jgi:putative Mg2+ transporter-C (MgtC) family protein
MSFDYFFVSTQASPLIGVMQLVIAMALGMLLGIERNIAGKTAGMRTYALVTMGSTLFIIVANAVMSGDSWGRFDFDPLRMASAIVTGIGFLGAGIIIFRETTLRGLTTAAGLWLSAGIGIAVGFEQYLVAVCATLLTLFIFSALWLLETKITAHISPKTPFDSRIDPNEDRP